jgi:hypothetical protein
MNSRQVTSRHDSFKDGEYESRRNLKEKRTRGSKKKLALTSRVTKGISSQMLTCV